MTQVGRLRMYDFESSSTYFALIKGGVSGQDSQDGVCNNRLWQQFQEVYSFFQPRGPLFSPHKPCYVSHPR